MPGRRWKRYTQGPGRVGHGNPSASILTPYQRRAILSMVADAYPDNPNPRRVGVGKSKLRVWVCGCGRRHEIPNVVRDDFNCPMCGEQFHG